MATKKDELDSFEEGVEEFVHLCLERMEYEANNASKRCIGHNAARDSAKVRYAICPGAGACTFCAMLGSRGFVYHDASSCEGLHAHCTCCAVPGFDGENSKVEGYDPDYWWDRWKNPERAKDELMQDIESPTVGKQLIKRARDGYNVRYIQTTQWGKIPTTDEIVSLIGGGDKTKGGSCASVAFAYFGNKGGELVRDFRGGASRRFFATYANIKEIANMEGVVSIIEEHKNAFTAANAVLQTVQEGKKYCLVAGRHVSVIEKRNKVLYFLEMQSPTENGWHELNNKTLRSRFKCRASKRYHGIQLDQSAILIEGETLSNSSEFKELMGFINTLEANQQKGVGGYAK